MTILPKKHVSSSSQEKKNSGSGPGGPGERDSNEGTGGEGPGGPGGPGSGEPVSTSSDNSGVGSLDGGVQDHELNPENLSASLGNDEVT